MRAASLFFWVPGLPSWFLEPGPAPSACAVTLSPFPSLSVLLGSPVSPADTALLGLAPWGLDSFHFGIFMKGSFHFLAPVLELNSYFTPVTRREKYNDHINKGNSIHSLLPISTLSRRGSIESRLVNSANSHHQPSLSISCAALTTQ